VSVAGGGSEDSGDGAPVETEPVREAELPPPTTEEVSTGVGEPLPEVEQPPLEEAPSAEPGPAYEPTAPPPVENQPLSAPPSSTSEPEADHAATSSTDLTGTFAWAEPAMPTEEEPPATQPAAVPAEPNEARSGLAGRGFHTVRAGECLWSIAAALLPGGASNAEVAAEVQRLWHLNASRIGTGHPNLLMVGTRLRLH
jgi:hypothetical protein